MKLGTVGRLDQGGYQGFVGLVISRKGTSLHFTYSIAGAHEGGLCEVEAARLTEAQPLRCRYPSGPHMAYCAKVSA